MSVPVEAVNFNAGEGKESQFALVLKDHKGGTLDLLWVDDNGSWNAASHVPRREPADYGPEGGGDTWHERH